MLRERVCDRTLFDHASIGEMDYDLPRESDVGFGWLFSGMRLFSYEDGNN